jgi:hypothetical protein
LVKICKIISYVSHSFSDKTNYNKHLDLLTVALG